MRVITAIQAVRQRFGRTGEQFYTWIQVPLSMLGAGVWLLGLSIFISSVFGFSMEWIIVCVGLTVMINSTLGGSWAVSASDFIQMLILMMVVLVMAYYSLSEIGGSNMMIERFPVDSILGDNYNYPEVIIAWIVLVLMSQMVKTNHILGANRYLTAKNSDQAKKAALLASILFIVGPMVWFIPPIVARILIPDMGVVFPELNNPSDAAYIAVAFHVLPQGMMGLLIVGMFAATMTSMDSGLNRNSGIIVKNIYVALIKPKASEAEQLFVGKVFTVVLSVLIILIALFYSTLKGLMLFDLMISIGALLVLPVAVPLLLGLLIKRTPEWSGWSTTIVGLACSAAVKFHFHAEWFGQVFNMEMLSRDIRYWNITAAIVVNLTIPVLWFLGTMKFYREPVGERNIELETFWNNQSTPVEHTDEENDKEQYKLVGGLALAYGIFVFFMCLIPNPLEGRLIFLICGSILMFLGYFLYKRSAV